MTEQIKPEKEETKNHQEIQNITKKYNQPVIKTVMTNKNVFKMNNSVSHITI